MRSIARRSTLLIAAGVALLLATALPVAADPVSFDWATFNAQGATTYGVYDQDDSTVLATGSVVQLIWAGPDEQINLPAAGGAPGGDDWLLDTSTVENAGNLLPFMRDKGYVPLKTYTFDTGDAWNGGAVYIRAWNAAAAGAGTAYGDSVTSTLTNGAVFNAPRWHTGTPWDATASITWGSYNLNGDTTEGVYDADNATVLQTGDLVQLIWAGADGQPNAPVAEGVPGGDDRLLAVSAVENDPGPAAQQNKGYVLAKGYTFHLGDPWNGGVIYMRAWNAGGSATADHYGDSSTGALADGVLFNAPRWHTGAAWSQLTVKTYLPLVVR